MLIADVREDTIVEISGLIRDGGYEPILGCSHAVGAARLRRAIAEAPSAYGIAASVRRGSGPWLG